MITFNRIIDFDALFEIGKSSSQDYQNKSPFPHFVRDNVFDEEVLNEILEEFEISEQAFFAFDTKYEKKLQMNKEEHFGPMTLNFFHQLNSSRFLAFLEELTGIERLLPDPYLSGGGLHKIPSGGKLGIHVDFNKNEQLGLYRRVNVLIYLNKDWKEEYGGHFELWGDRYGKDKKKLLPIFNRMAIFTTTRDSFHGHPEPLTCPQDRSRKSLAFYYYTAGDRGNQAATAHSTIFVDKAGKEEELGKIHPLRQVARKFKRLISNNNEG